MNDEAFTSLEVRYQEIRRKISGCFSAGQSSAHIVLIAVSKTQSADKVEELYRLGHRDFGENYVQELIEKASELERRGCTEIRWHFIGHLQTNKVKAMMPYVACIHTVDSCKLAGELSKRWTSLERSGPLPVFIQVNIDQEESKSGFLPQELPDQVSTLREIPGLSFQGLMCIPAASADSRSAFVRLRELEMKMQPLTHGRLSMGMSNDFETALQEGATHVRVGTALFGAR